MPNDKGEMMNKKGLMLNSGGLDSLLAIGLMQKQGIEIEAVCFLCPFSEGVKEKKVAHHVRYAADFFGIKQHYVMLGQEYIDMMKESRHGCGAAVNPCIDCRILMIRKAKDMLASVGASFLVTGEVVGERPMSQKKNTMFLIERRADAEGMIVRPLSGQILPPTKAEEAGIIARSLMDSISGRSRQRQMELVEEFGITEFPQPAGGCILTDTNFAPKLNDLWQHEPEAGVKEHMLLRWGRHFRYNDEIKIVIGRDARENDLVEKLSHSEAYLFYMKSITGPLLVYEGPLDDDGVQFAASAVKRFSKARDEDISEVVMRSKSGDLEKIIEARKIDEEYLQSLLIKG